MSDQAGKADTSRLLNAGIYQTGAESSTPENTRKIRATGQGGSILNACLRRSVNSYFQDDPDPRDWKLWVDRGLIDIVCPMDYHREPEIVREHTIGNTRMCAGKAELWVGIYKGLPDFEKGPYTTGELRLLAQAARDGLADGVVIFHWKGLSDEDLSMLRAF